MILGSVTIDGHAVHTHRDSYLLTALTVVSVRRPLLAGSVLLAAGCGGFAWSFADLLFENEIRALGVAAGIVLTAGLLTGQLKLLSRDLRGSELSGAVWGTYRHLGRIRREIVAAARSANGSAGS
ncbi:MAG: hypothetical protein H6851_02300 [Geminicoccaceae bacterium]|nr:hypothetical protein [Geminicoccaceae bacterium]